jgi:hypothetical protein
MPRLKLLLLQSRQLASSKPSALAADAAHMTHISLAYLAALLTNSELQYAQRV